MEKRPSTPWFPSYLAMQDFLKIMDGVRYSQYESMQNEINALHHSQKTIDWSKQEWIPENLTGESHELALHFWRESRRRINLRYLGCLGYVVLFTNRHKLLVRLSNDDTLQITRRGKCFLHNEEKTIREIDEYEGLLFILCCIAESGPGSRKDFYSAFKGFWQSYVTNKASTQTIEAALFYRLKNLICRNFVEKSNRGYRITDMGLCYLRSCHHPALARLWRKQNVRQQLEKYIQEIDPYKFEQLIKRLYEKMGYKNVMVTPKTGDGGVDVVGDIVLDNRHMREVIQVKRWKSPNNVGIRDLRILRDSDQYFSRGGPFDERRATIITTSSFTRYAKNAAFERDAMPITLIDGEELLDLLIEYEIGVYKKGHGVLELDHEKLEPFKKPRQSSLSMKN